MATFATNLKAAMGKMTISDLARRTGLPPSTISRHLNETHSPNLRALELYERELPKLRRRQVRRRAA